MTEKIDIKLNINGHDHAVRVEPRKTLVDVIRDECGLTGTHIGCEHGICGACTVILDNDAVRSCLMFAVQAQGKRIRTVEGLADGDNLHPVQSAFIEHHALQCGFCTPGFLMLTVNALETNPDLTDDDILDLLSSNLCHRQPEQRQGRAQHGRRHASAGRALISGPASPGTIAKQSQRTACRSTFMPTTFRRN
jgi:aerobic-type carbon monoxide dehydrogenase small subunit (CoxS/CutS family)